MAADTFTGKGNYNTPWASIYSIEFPVEYWQEWFQKYGKGFKLLDFLNMTGRAGANIASRTFYHFEDATTDKVINVRAATIIAGAAGAVITFQIEAADYINDGTNYFGPLRQHFSVLIPAAYQTPGEDRLYVIQSIAGNAPNETFTAYPLSTDSQMSGTVPASTELMIAGSYFAPGTGQPDGMVNGTYRRTHSTQIAKESCGLEGGRVARRNYREVITKSGEPGLFNKALIETEFRLDRQIDLSLFIGEPNANTALLTQASNFGGTNARLGTKGLWKWQSELAQTKNYTDTFSMDDFDDVKPLLQSQGVVDATVLFAYGPTLGLQVENGVLEGMKEWSGGTNLFTNNNFGVTVKSVTKNGVNFLCKELASFAHPNLLGNDSYTFDTSGFIVPIGEVPVRLGNMANEKVTVPNLSIAYYNHNGEDRTRIMGDVAGLNGLGYNIVNEYDGLHYFILAEFALFCANVNQHIQVIKTS